MSSQSDVAHAGAIRCGVYDAKSRLSELLSMAESGCEVVITRHGRDVARLISMVDAPSREFGFDRGVVVIGDDFDDPLPGDMFGELG